LRFLRIGKPQGRKGRKDGSGQGVLRQWRLRVGDWRVLFTLDDAARTMIVLRVLPRGGAYR